MGGWCLRSPWGGPTELTDTPGVGRTRAARSRGDVSPSTPDFGAIRVGRRPEEVPATGGRAVATVPGGCDSAQKISSSMSGTGPSGPGPSSPPRVGWTPTAESGSPPKSPAWGERAEGRPDLARMAGWTA